MLKSIHWDVYTIVITALIPTVMLTAWGITEWDESRIHRQQCEVAERWLGESALIAPLFQNARTMSGVGTWILGIEEINSPTSAGKLRHGILSSAHYHMEHFPNESTTEAGVLNPKNGLFERTITEGAGDLIEHCPEVESLLPDAFPMVFPEEGQN